MSTLMKFDMQSKQGGGPDKSVLLGQIADFLNEWDPIGLGGDLQRGAKGEYDGYARGILDLLVEGAPESRICEELCDIARNSMEIGVDVDFTKKIAKKICDWYHDLDK